MQRKRLVVLSLAIIVLLTITGIFIYKNFFTEPISIYSQPVELRPLTEEQYQNAAESIISSGITQEISDENPITIFFYDFEKGERIWYNGFLIGNEKFFAEGQSEVAILMHVKYISEMTPENLCEIVGKANKNGDLSIESEGNKAKLLIKYSKLLKYKDCLG